MSWTAEGERGGGEREKGGRVSPKGIGLSRMEEEERGKRANSVGLVANYSDESISASV